VADHLDAHAIRADPGDHPGWCDRRACRVHPPGDIGSALVLHALVLLEEGGYVVTLRQRDLLDADTGRWIRPDPARVFITCDGVEVVVVPPEQNDTVQAAISRAAAITRAE
jgi:hypothetical protein